MRKTIHCLAIMSALGLASAARADEGPADPGAGSMNVTATIQTSFAVEQSIAALALGDLSHEGTTNAKQTFTLTTNTASSLSIDATDGDLEHESQNPNSTVGVTYKFRIGAGDDSAPFSAGATKSASLPITEEMVLANASFTVEVDATAAQIDHKKLAGEYTATLVISLAPDQAGD
ncbi:MAG: hypothetical protein KIT58_24250 [Planctomycetota bacterium]|nr:hypothetical protein [Planctomycetota bacterium]